MNSVCLAMIFVTRQTSVHLFICCLVVWLTFVWSTNEFLVFGNDSRDAPNERSLIYCCFEWLAQHLRSKHMNSLRFAIILTTDPAIVYAFITFRMVWL